MNLNKSNLHILLHRPTPWESDVHCSTKIYAKQFKKAGYKVTYLENPMDPVHLLKWKGYYHVWRKAPRWEDGIWIINPFSVVPIRDHFLFRTKKVAYASYCSCIPTIKSLVKRSGQGEPDVIWTTKPGSSILKDIFPKATLVFQVVDFYPAFRGEYIKTIEKADYERADHIFLIGNALLPYITDELGIPAGKITVLGQGVSIEQYDTAGEEPESLKNIPRPRAIWVGVIGKGDSALFEAVAKKMQQIGGSLVLIGPDAEWARILKGNYKNIYILGPKAPEKIPDFLAHSDIGLMLYNSERENVYQGQNPLKLYEYAAAGLPIISTPHEEFKYIKPPVIEVSEPGDLAKAIDFALEESEGLQAASQSFAGQYSWQSCFDRAEEKILLHIQSGL